MTDNPSQPNTHGFMGSEEFIRLQFEEYLLSLLSSIKYHLYYKSHRDQPHLLRDDIDGDPAPDFNIDFLDAWQRTQNFRIFQSHTDSHLFDIVLPRHICAGGLTIEDIQRRFAETLATLNLDERLSTSRDALNKTFLTSQKKISTMWSELREYQIEGSPESPRREMFRRVPTLTQEAGQSVAAAGARAGAYFSSWATWAREGRKKSDQETTPEAAHPVVQEKVVDEEKAHEAKEDLAPHKAVQNLQENVKPEAETHSKAGSEAADGLSEKPL